MCGAMDMYIHLLVLFPPRQMWTSQYQQSSEIHTYPLSVLLFPFFLLYSLFIINIVFSHSTQEPRSCYSKQGKQCKCCAW